MISISVSRPSTFLVLRQELEPVNSARSDQGRIKSLDSIGRHDHLNTIKIIIWSLRSTSSWASPDHWANHHHHHQHHHRHHLKIILPGEPPTCWPATSQPANLIFQYFYQLSITFYQWSSIHSLNSANRKIFKNSQMIWQVMQQTIKK